MIDISVITEAGLTEGEAKVYLALLKLGSSTTGPIVEESGVANSFVYRILHNLIEKGLASYITKEKTKYFQAAEPERIIDYIEKRKNDLESQKEKILLSLPQLKELKKSKDESSVRFFEGFKGYITAWEYCYTKLQNGDEYHFWGIDPEQDEKYHAYWKRDHMKRAKLNIKAKLLFNQGNDPKILKNRNSYAECDARYMPIDLKSTVGIIVYKNVAGIFLQGKKPLAIQIINNEIANSFEEYFQMLWKRTKPFKYSKKTSSVLSVF